MTANGSLENARIDQAKAWLWTETAETLVESLRRDPEIRERIAVLESAVAKGDTSPAVAARELVEAFLKERGDNQ